MFNRKILDRLVDEKFDNGWTVHRADTRTNSSPREWQSIYTNHELECKLFEINLDKYDYNERWLSVTIGFQNVGDIKHFKDAFTQFAKNAYPSFPLSVNYSYNFPNELVLRNIHLSLGSKIIGNLVDLTNKIFTEISPEKSSILPKDILEKEAAFIANHVAPSAAAIHPNWAQSARKNR